MTWRLWGRRAGSTSQRYQCLAAQNSEAAAAGYRIKPAEASVRDGSDVLIKSAAIYGTCRARSRAHRSGWRGASDGGHTDTDTSTVDQCRHAACIARSEGRLCQSHFPSFSSTVAQTACLWFTSNRQSLAGRVESTPRHHTDRYGFETARVAWAA